MRSVFRRFGSFLTHSLKQTALHAVPLLAIGLAAASHASATTVCGDTVLTLLGATLIHGSGGVPGCIVNATLPGLTLYTTSPINSVFSETSVAQVEATWTVVYTGKGPASTTVAWDVLVSGTSGQSVTWALDVEPTGGPVHQVAGSTFMIDPSGTSVFNSSALVSPIYPGNYTVDLMASSLMAFNVSAPANTSVDLTDPTPNGTVPEPASVATLGLGLAAGLLIVSRRRKKQ